MINWNCNKKLFLIQKQKMRTCTIKEKCWLSAKKFNNWKLFEKEMEEAEVRIEVSLKHLRWLRFLFCYQTGFQVFFLFQYFDESGTLWMFYCDEGTMISNLRFCLYESVRISRFKNVKFLKTDWNFEKYYYSEVTIIFDCLLLRSESFWISKVWNDVKSVND